MFAAPGIAGAQTEAVVTVPDRVTGTAGMVVTLPVVEQPVTVVVTDQTAAVASWTFAEPVEAGQVHVDLGAPHVGVPPVNGAGAVAVQLGDATVHEAPLVIDLSPGTPALSAIAAGESVRLFWAAVAGPGPVTYRLERSVSAGIWSTLVESAKTGHHDAAVEPGRYRYRLTALVPAAEGGFNTSAGPEVAVRVIEAPADDKNTEPEPATAKPPVRKPPIPDLPPKPRRVRVAGENVTAVRPDAKDPQGRARAPRAAARRPVMTSSLTLNDLPRGFQGPRFAAPAAASARTVQAPKVPVQPPPVFPVTVPPAGTLAVESSAAVAAAPPLIVLASVLLLVLLLAEGAVLLLGRRRITPAPVDLQ